MGCTVREKSTRTNRAARRTVKPDPFTKLSAAAATGAFDGYGSNGEMDMCKSIMESGFRQLGYQLGLSVTGRVPNSGAAGPNSVFDDSGWGYCTEEQLEEILLKNLEFLYAEAIAKLVDLGYDEEVALRAILRNGHCYGGMDVLTNILHNCLAYLNSGCCGETGDAEEIEPVFEELRQLEEYSLAGMVCLLQQVKPHLSRGDAMWCLLMSDLHVGRASVMDIPVLPSPNGNGSSTSSVSGGNVEAGLNGPVGVAPALCRFHSGWGFGNGGTSEFPMNGFFSYASELTLQKEIDCPKRFNLTPSMKTLLKRNVALFAAGFRANSRLFQSQLQASPSSGDASVGGGGVKVESVVPVVGQGEENQSVKNQDVVNSVLNKFRELNLDENSEQQAPLDQKDNTILSLIHQIKDLERQVKERKDWAHQKAMQAARKLSHDLTELKILKMEREETQRLKKGKQNLEDTTMKRLTEMENSLRKASGQVDRANAAVRKLETENAEIRAEMQASKLSASESVASSLEAAKREKKYLKKLMAWEKQKAKLQEEINADKQKISNIKQQLADVGTAQKTAEAKWTQEQKEKELALTKVEEEQRLKEAAEANTKRRLEALRLKSEIDFQRHKDDLQRLEQELARMKAAQKNEQHHSDNTVTGRSTKPQGDSIDRRLHEFDRVDSDSGEKEASFNRECIICQKDEVSVVFLPCAHQVICANCNEVYGKRGRATCPSCRVLIEQRVRVFGASS